MEDVIEVMQLWANYRKSHPATSFEDFCRFYLASPRIKDMATSIPESAGPPDIDGMFMMAVSRCTLAFWVYMRIALRDTSLPTIEDIMLCAALINLGESRKSDVINYAMMEISTGTDNLNRLIKKRFVMQRIDPDDRRSKLVKISPSGQRAFKKCIGKARLAREIFLADLDENDKKLVATILYPVQEKQRKLSVANKGRTIEDIYNEVVAKRKMKR